MVLGVLFGKRDDVSQGIHKGFTMVQEYSGIPRIFKKNIPRISLDKIIPNALHSVKSSEFKSF